MFSGSMLHDGAVALNCGRNCLGFLIKAYGIKKIYIPYFCCKSVSQPCEQNHIEIEYYHIDKIFRPVFEKKLGDNEWLYIVNFYGQISKEEIKEWKEKYGRIIIDNAQAYFQTPVYGVDTLYTCRKFIGVPDGAFLYTNVTLEEELLIDESYDRMKFVLGRFERTASEFYRMSVVNNELFKQQPIKRMSALTANLLRGVDYLKIKDIRTQNFSYLHKRLGIYNELKIQTTEGAFAYPLFMKGAHKLRKNLADKKIYIPTLWPDVLEKPENTLEYQYANDILPLPCDQRYGWEHMETICNAIEQMV